MVSFLCIGGRGLHMQLENNRLLNTLRLEVVAHDLEFYIALYLHFSLRMWHMLY